MLQILTMEKQQGNRISGQKEEEMQGCMVEGYRKDVGMFLISHFSGMTLWPRPEKGTAECWENTSY